MQTHHDHDHPHPHPTRPDGDEPLGYYQVMEVALRELLIEKGVLTADEIRRQVEDMDSRTPARGAQVVAHAWFDPGFKARLLADGNAALEEIGLDRGTYKLVVVENTLVAPPDSSAEKAGRTSAGEAGAPAVHNVIVCTLCSCYPRWLLGLPPDWYKSRSYRARVASEPRAVLREFGLDLPADTVVRVHDSTADMRYLVLPARPAGTQGWDEQRLAAIVTRDCMVGVALPKA